MFLDTFKNDVTTRGLSHERIARLKEQQTSDCDSVWFGALARDQLHNVPIKAIVLAGYATSAPSTRKEDGSVRDTAVDGEIFFKPKKLEAENTGWNILSPVSSVSFCEV